MIFNQMIYYDKNKFPLHAIGEVKEITEKDLKNVTKIENHAFSYSDSLEKVIIPESVALIKDKAFYGSKNLKTIIIKGNNVKTLEDANAFGNSYISKLTQENITSQTLYRGSDYTRIYNSNPNDWGEADWHNWHSGKLNNNMILIQNKNFKSFITLDQFKEDFYSHPFYIIEIDSKDEEIDQTHIVYRQ